MIKKILLIFFILIFPFVNYITYATDEIISSQMDALNISSFIKEGETGSIKKVGGKEETRQFLENLGFVTGADVKVVSVANGNLIVNIKDSRIAIGKDMAARIMV